jgi:CBS domain-containing protein
MARTAVADVMTRRVVFLPGETTLDEAAQVMRDQSIGDVVVTHGPTMAGLVTDRDIVVRAVAEGLPVATTTLESIATSEHKMVVCDADRKLVGIISMSDVAQRSTSASTSA